MLKQGIILHIMNQTDHHLKEKIKIGYLIDDCDENKKAKGTKSCVRKGELNFEEYKHCLEPTRVEYKPTRTK